MRAREAGQAMRYVMVGVCVAVATVFHVTYALALTQRDAGTVVEILEQLAPERGETVYYDDEAAADWLEFDRDGNGLIARAGFTASSWRSAYDSTLKGLIASIPEAEFDAIFANLDGNMAALPGLSDQQKTEIVAEMRTQMQKLRLLRTEGATYRDAVLPYLGRLRDLAEF